MITLRSLLSHPYVRRRGCDSYRVYLTLSTTVWLTPFLSVDDYPICILHDLSSGSINNINLLYTSTTRRPPLVYSPSNLSDTELTQWRSSADLRDRDEPRRRLR